MTSSTRRQTKTRNKQQTKSGLNLNQCIGPKPGDDDAVLGRGGESNHHTGTKNFRDMVDSRKREFAKAKTNREKSDIVMGCLACLKAHGGRIVGKWEGVYYEATEKRQYAKVIQRLREQKGRQPRATKALLLTKKKKKKPVVSDDDATTTDDDTSNATISSGSVDTNEALAKTNTSTVAEELDVGSGEDDTTIATTDNNATVTQLEFRNDSAVPGWPLLSFIPMMDTVDDLNVLDEEIDELFVGGGLFEEAAW